MKLLLTTLLCLLSLAASARTVTDLAGRSVTLPDKIGRVVLGEGRFMVALAILEGADLPSRIVGSMDEFSRLDPDGYAQYLKRFPELAQIPRVGQASADSFSLEKTLSLKPQLAIFGLGGHGPSPKDETLLKGLQAAGVPVVFIDFRNDPLVNTPRSMRLLGQVLGREREAEAYLRFYESELARVTDGLRGLPRTRVFLESRVGLREECCETMVRGMMGRFIDAAGGENVARELVPGEVGQVSAEYLLTHQPDVYIATAIGNRTTVQSGPQRIQMGAGISAADAQASLARRLQGMPVAALTAVKAGRAHAVWHHFYDSPLNVVAVQAFAKWLHPERFATLDPNATLRTLYERFQPIPLNGVYWSSAR
ncbi:ABC transporter substrate-binding protein [Viridibacterium curvum]|uniref:Iron-siderophore ABC transporter substrate-binding protein YiuA n=1 Tax=Viridibacterium curvum TaxID=1101404 RepID=A0ABP9QFA8_9RHOO